MDDPPAPTPPPSPAVPVLPGALHPRRIDKVLHDPIRLAMVTALTVTPALSFSEMKHALGVTDGNLGVHARRLQDVGYVSVHRQARHKATRTEYRLAPAGRRALERYLQALQALIDTVRAATAAPIEF